MKGFDIKRFVLTMKWDMISNWKDSLKIMLTMGFAMFIIFAMTLFSRRRVDVTEWVADMTIHQMGGFCMLVFGVFMIVGASRVFNNMKTKQQRTAFLMLPASNAEKFVVRWLWATVGQAVLFVVALVLADLLQVLFGMLIGVGVLGSVTAEFFRLVSEIMGGGAREFYHVVDRELGSALTISLFVLMLSLFTHAFYVFGGVFFRRNPWLLTTCAGFILLFIITAIDPISLWLTVDTGKEGVLQTMRLWSGGLLVLTVACYWAGYWLFKRMQVINNKWTNV